MIPILIIVPAILIAISCIFIYNKLATQQIEVTEGLSGIDIQLKKRYDLVPNLVETVKGYAKHEKSTFESVVSARSAAVNASDQQSQQKAETDLNKALLNLFALAEQYPKLKASKNFQNLQSELAEIEDDIEKSRRYFNGVVREFNMTIVKFPSNLIAGLFGFRKATFFELENMNERLNPHVQF